jgi:hypothetical protein
MKGSQYMMVLTESDSDAILVEPMKNRTSGEMNRAYQTLINRLRAAGIAPKQHILDNECSNDFKETIKVKKVVMNKQIPTNLASLFKERTDIKMASVR